MGILICLMTLVAGEICVWLIGGSLLTIIELIQVIFYIVLNVFFSSSLVFFITNFVHSTSAFSGLSTIIGTLAGFLSAIYIPLGGLPENIQKILKGLPLLPGSSLMREVLTRDILAVTFKNCPEELKMGYMEYMGISIHWGNQVINSQIKVEFLLLSGIILVILSAFIQRKRITVIR